MEKKEKRRFTDNELRKHRISMAQRRKWSDMKHSQLNLNESDYSGTDDTDMEFIESEYIRTSNQISNLVLKIIDIIPVRAYFHEKVKKYCLDKIDKSDEEMQDNADHKKKITITPEQKERLFYGNKDNEDDNGED